MDRPSRQLARSERMASNSPYKRPQQQLAQTTPKSPIASFPSLRSIYSFVTAPFSRQPLLPQTNRDLQVEEDQKSQSGSEDGWNGSPPPGMEREDVTSLAAAGRRVGIDSAEEGRAPPQEDLFSSRASTGLTASTSLEVRPSEPGYPVPLQQSTSLVGIPSSSRQGLPTNQQTYGTKRPISSSVTPTVPSHKLLPSFLPQASTGLAAQSPASIALTAFVEAKKGGIMSPHDMRIMKTLMEEMEAEQQGSSSSYQAKGWTAGMPVDSPRQVKSIRESQAQAGPSTPNRFTNSVRGSPGPLFSVGSPGGRSELGANGGESPASRRIRYLGPGMSPKRMLNRPRSSDKPLFTSDVAEESEPKRQKIDSAPQTPSKDTSTVPTPQVASPSGPALLQSVRSRALEKTKSSATPARPSPLSRSAESPAPPSPREQQSIEQGKRRAADIVKELMEKEIGPIETLSKRDYMVINPYDLAPASSTPAAPSSSLSKSVSRSATPKKSILRSSLKGSASTPLSGAAAKLEAYKPGRKLTTLELLEGKRPWTDNVADQSMLSRTPTPERDTAEVDELMEESPAPSHQRSPSPPAATEEPAQPEEAISRPLPKMPAPFEPSTFKAPEVSSPARPVPSFSASPAPKAAQPKPASEASKMAPPPLPKFAPSAHKPTPPLAEIENSTLASISKASTKSSKAMSSAQRKALGKSAGDLPKYLFEVIKAPAAPSTAAKKAALANPIISFTFVLTPSTPSTASTSTQPASSASWTCSLCMLQNPATAVEKCTVCEAPRPAAKPAQSAPASASTPFGFGSQATSCASSGPWTCDTCMLQNPDSAKEKCQICEARRPAPKSAASAAPTTPFGFGSLPPTSAKSGQWTCDTCMLQNPDSAKEKCTVCEARRPAPKAAGSGFSFGATASAPASRAPGPWTCDLCMLQNPESAKEKCQICEAKRP